MNVFGNTIESELNRNILNLKSSLNNTNNDLVELKQVANKHQVCIDMLEEKFKLLSDTLSNRLNEINSSLLAFQKIIPNIISRVNTIEVKIEDQVSSDKAD